MGLALRDAPRRGPCRTPRSASRRASGCCCSARRARASRRCCTAWPACSAATTRASRPARCTIDGEPAARVRGRAGHGAAGPRQPGDPRARRRRRRLRLREPRRRRATRSGSGCATRSTPSDSTSPSTGRPPRSPAGRSSGSRSRACSRCARASSCSTSRPPTSTPTGVAEVRDAVRRALDAPARRSSWSSTGSTSGCRSWTASSCSAAPARVGVIADGTPDAVLRDGGRARRRRRLGSRHPARLPAAAGRTAGRDPAAAREALVVARVRGHRGRRTARPRRARRRGARHRRAERRGQVDARAHPRGAASRPSRAGSRHPLALAGGRGSRPRSAWPSRALLTRIGTVFQEPEHQLLTTTVRAELEVGPRALGLPRAEIAERVDELLERLRLGRARRGEPVHAVGRREAAADGRGGARDAARGSGARRADLRAGCRAPGPSSSADRRAAAATTAPRSWRSRTTRRCSRRCAPGDSRSGPAHERRGDRPGSRRGPIADLNPVAKLGAALLIALPLVLTIDPVSAAVALLLELPLLAARRARAGASSGCARCRSGSPRRWRGLTIALYGAHERRGLRRVVRGAHQRRIAHARAGDVLPRARDRAARRRALRHGRPDRPRRRTRAAAAAARALRARRARGHAAARACSPTTGGRSRSRDARAASPTRAASGGCSAWRSRCSCCRSAAGPRSRPRWRRAASAARGPRTWARESHFGWREWVLLAGRRGDLGDRHHGGGAHRLVELHPGRDRLRPPRYGVSAW